MKNEATGYSKGDSVSTMLKKWRHLADTIDEIKMREIKPLDNEKKELESEISNLLDIGDNVRSETVSVPQCGSAYKKLKLSAKVHDWEIFQRYLVRNDLQYAMRKQVNLSAIEEIHEQIITGELPQPKGVEFTTFNKLYIRRS